MCSNKKNRGTEIVRIENWLDFHLISHNYTHNAKYYNNRGAIAIIGRHRA